jgi:hypothetical protein
MTDMSAKMYCIQLKFTGDGCITTSPVYADECDTMKVIADGHMTFSSLLSNRLRCLQSFTINYSINNVKVLAIISSSVTFELEIH